ncbi:Phage portal protein [Clavibacter michiganensis subsp. michiganensis]|nr:Phage portal protein [Clavibacter michiganensis subsp. michiganensis]
MGKIRNAAEAMGFVGSSVVRQSVISDATIPIVSPWATSPNHLGQALVLNDIYGEDFRPTLPITVDEAMQVPAVVKARAILHALIVPRPLVAYRGAAPAANQPTWLYRSDDPFSLPAQQRTARILDDHIFHGSSMLHIDARGADGFPIEVSHVEFERWEVKPDRTIYIDGEIADGNDFIFIPGPWGGLLKHAAEKVRDSRSLDRSAGNRARNPIPAYEIHVVDDTLEDEELAVMKRQIAKDRMDPNGAILVTSAGVELKVHGDRTIDLHEQGRNAIRLDIANLLNIPASLLEGASEGSSLDYTNQQGRRSELFDHTLSYWITPIQYSLSTDRIVPRGQSIRFDFSDYLTPIQTVTPVED